MRVHWPWLVPALAVLCLLLRAAPAAGAPPPHGRTSSLAWVRSDGAEACIGNKALAAAVEQVLGRPTFVAASAADVSIEGRIEKRDAGWRATLRVSDDQGKLLGTRELESPNPDCRRMDESIVFVVAVMIDPDATMRPALPAAPAPAPATSSPPAVSPSPSPRSPAHWQLTPEVGLAASVGQLPDPGWGPTARVRIGPPAVGVELAGTFLLPQDQAVPGVAGATVRWTLAYAGASLCPTLATAGPVGFIGCAGIAAGTLTARPDGLAGAQQAADVVVLGTVQARAQWRFASSLLAGLDAGVALPFSRGSYAFADASGASRELFQPSVVAGTAEVTFGVCIE